MNAIFIDVPAITTPHFDSYIQRTEYMTEFPIA